MHRFRRTFVAALLVAVLAACTTTSTVHRRHSPSSGQAYGFAFESAVDDDLEGVARLVRVIRKRLADAGLLATDAAPRARIEVALTHFYVRSDATRVLAGILAGRDRIASEVTVFDATGKPVGRFDVETTNLSAWGSSDGLLERHADEIVARLGGRGGG